MKILNHLTLIKDADKTTATAETKRKVLKNIAIGRLAVILEVNLEVNLEVIRLVMIR